jgi:hypothetical protein
LTMVTFEQAEKSAEKCIHRVDACKDYRDFYVFVRDTESRMDGAPGMVAVNKASGKCSNFVTVISRLGVQTGYYRRDASGSFVPSKEE